MHNDYMAIADQLLAAVPEALRDKPNPLLAGATPREAAKHVAEAGCMACRAELQDVAKAS